MALNSPAYGSRRPVGAGGERPEPAAAAARPVLSVEGLKTYFFTRDGVVRAVDGVSYDLRRGETLGVVGESGCGKSVTALSIMRLVPSPPGRIVAGSVKLDGVDLLTVSESRMRQIRGNEVSMIFQEPMTSLNPVLKIGRQLTETIRLHQGLSKRDALDKAVEMLRLVHIPEAERRVHQYPFELSGGMRQRVMIAMALSCNPKVLIADEATTALDVTIQAQILNLMLELREKLGTAIVLITHDLGVVAETAQRVVVMYAGKVVEEAPVRELFARPLHPYTKGLLGSIPRLPARGASRPAAAARSRLNEIPGMVPSLADLPAGCRFALRCSYATDRCRREEPAFEPKAPGHWSACFEAERLRAEAASRAG
jgi:oligopeptide/dipeptide ABC transporter ATP-binding protein